MCCPNTPESGFNNWYAPDEDELMNEALIDTQSQISPTQHKQNTQSQLSPVHQDVTNHNNNYSTSVPSVSQQTNSALSMDFRHATAESPEDQSTYPVTSPGQFLHVIYRIFPNINTSSNGKNGFDVWSYINSHVFSGPNLSKQQYEGLSDFINFFQPVGQTKINDFTELHFDPRYIYDEFTNIFTLTYSADLEHLTAFGYTPQDACSFVFCKSDFWEKISDHWGAISDHWGTNKSNEVIDTLFTSINLTQKESIFIPVYKPFSVKDLCSGFSDSDGCIHKCRYSLELCILEPGQKIFFGTTQ